MLSEIIFYSSKPAKCWRSEEKSGLHNKKCWWLNKNVNKKNSHIKIIIFLSNTYIVLILVTLLIVSVISADFTCYISYIADIFYHISWFYLLYQLHCWWFRSSQQILPVISATLLIVSVISADLLTMLSSAPHKPVSFESSNHHTTIFLISN